MKETLVPLYNLDLTVEEKPVMNVDDLYLVLHYHWIMDTHLIPMAGKFFNWLFFFLPLRILQVDQGR